MSATVPKRGHAGAYGAVHFRRETLISVRPVILVTPAKEMVVEPELFLNAELDSQLHRLEQVERSKWEALAELGLDRAEDRLLPAGRRGGGRL